MGTIPKQSKSSFNLIKIINILYPAVVLTLISLVYGVQIAAFITGKRNFELPFSLYFMIAILIFEILCEITCVYIRRKYDLFNLLEKVFDLERNQTKTSHGIFVLSTAMCSVLIPAYFTVKVFEQLSSMNEKYYYYYVS